MRRQLIAVFVAISVMVAVAFVCLKLFKQTFSWGAR